MHRFNRITAVFAVVALAACTSVDETEYCVETRYGKVVNQKMSVGLNETFLTEPTCFSMTERNFPSDNDGKEMIAAQTQDPITVNGDLAIVYRYDPATVYKLFLEKRTPEAAEQEILNAIREGYRNALAQFTISEIFANRASVADSVKNHIQRKIGTRAVIVNVFVRDIKVPEAIETARIAAARQEQVLSQARSQAIIDSVNTRSLVIKAEGASRAKQLEAQSYSSNPQLLSLEIAKQQALGLANACKGGNVQTCVIGGSVMDTWRRQ